MITGPRDLYIPSDSWKEMVRMAAPNPTGMDAGFAKALDEFGRYAATIGGDIGESIQRCRDHLQRFLSAAQEVISAESGENSARLGRPRNFDYGDQVLIFQVFNYKDKDTVSIREDRLATLLTNYDRFHDTMQFMERKVNEGNLGILQNTFLFIHKPLEKAAVTFDKAMVKTSLVYTTVMGEKADPTYVHISGTEPSSEVDSGLICRVLKPGYAFEGREIQEGVVIVAE